MRLRFTDTHKWNTDYFYTLDPHCKLMLEYATDLCDVAGFVQEFPGMTQLKDVFRPWDEKEIIRCIRGIQEAFVMVWPPSSKLPKKIWSINYVLRQKNLPLTPAKPAHRGILKRLKDNHAEFEQFEDFAKFYEGFVKKPLMDLEEYRKTKLEERRNERKEEVPTKKLRRE